MPSTMMSTLQRQSLLLLILLLVRIAYAQTEDGCPAADAACSCRDNSVICVDLGQSLAMPRFNPSSTVFSMLSFQGDTRILKIQSQAFAGTQFRTFDLSDLGLTSLDPAAFASFNASVLSELILANNSLRTLPATVFTGLTSLRVLDLRNNYITQLRTNIFSDLRSSLTSLFLSNNLIGNGGLPVGLLNRFDQLTKLEIEDNLLTMWSPAQLAGSTKITELSLAGNRIRACRESTFTSLKQLVKLSLDRNDIAMLANGAFRNLTSLRQLDLSINRLSNLNEHSLKGLDFLATLNLSVNSLSDLSVGAFLPLIRLQSLDLSQNLLRQLPGGLFASKTTLTTLNLSGNNMTISNTTLRGLTSVTRLFLSGNGICTISSSLFGNLNQLHMLDLSDNKIVKMEAGLLSFSSKLKTINLSHNKLSEIPPDVFRNGPALTRIDLSQNSIRRINQNTFYNIHLTYIDLSYNEIEFIDPDAFYHIAELSTVLLNHNRFSAVPTELLSNIPALQNVNLDYNIIETLPATAFDWLYIDNLSVEGNKIRTIDPRAFDNVWITKSINLAKNRIEQISDNTFNYPASLSTISHISLSHNSLTEVTSGMFSGLSGLTSVDLSDNRIHTVADGAFSILRILKDLRLDGNRLNRQSMEYNWIGTIGTLRTLNLSSNGLNDQALPVVRGLSGLTELYLDSNFFTNLVLLPVMTSLNTLSVQNNSLSHIDYNGSASLSILNLGQNRLGGETLASSLKSFHNLTSLNLSENRLKVIPSNAFAPFASRLEELDLSGNGLNLSLAAFSELNNIRILTMDDNQLHDLSYLADTPVTKVLCMLSVKRNKLNSTVFSVLSNFTKLSKLFIDGNKIDHIPDRVFQSMYNIRVLSLGRNALQTVSSDTFSGLQVNCRHLDLSGNRLSQVNAQSFSSLKSLEHLDLSENNLTSITIPQIMPTLQVLNLGGNRLQRFPNGLRRFHRISAINVSHNSLVSLPSLAIFGNPNVRAVVVDFHQNSLLNSGDLRLIGSFGHVDFSSNNFSDLLPTLLMRAKYIDKFDLSKNKFNVLSPTIWQTVYTVNRLNMSRNHLILSLHNPLAIEDEQCGTILTALDLSYNSLIMFNAGQIQSLSSSLALLDIRSNRFESLPQSEFNNMTKLTHLFLVGNPWDCDCDIVWIRTLLRKDVYIDNAECIAPFDTKGQLVVCYTPPSDCPVDHLFNDTRCITTSAPTPLSTTSRSTPGLYPFSTTTTSTTTTSTTTTIPVLTTQLIPVQDSAITEPITSSSTTSPQPSHSSMSTVGVPSASTSTVTKVTTSLPTATEVDSKSPTTANFTLTSTSEFSSRTTATATTVIAPSPTILPVGIFSSSSVSYLTDTNVTILPTTTSMASFSSGTVFPSNLTSFGSSTPGNITSTTLFNATTSAFTRAFDASTSTVSDEATTTSSTLLSSSTSNATLAVSDLPVIPPSHKDTSTSLKSTHIARTPLFNKTFSTPVTMLPPHTDMFSTSSLRPNITTPSTVPVADASIVASTLKINTTTSIVSAEATAVPSTPSSTGTSNDSLAVSGVPVIPTKDTTSSRGSTHTATTPISNQTFSTPVTVPPSYTMSTVDTSSLRPNISRVPVVHASTVSINASVSAITGEAQTVPSTPLFTSAYNASFILTDFPVISPKDTTSSLEYTLMATTPLSNQTFRTPVTMPPSYPDTFFTPSMKPNITTPSVASFLNISTTTSTVSAEATSVSLTPSYSSTSNNDSFVLTDRPVIPPKDTSSSLASTPMATTMLSNQTLGTFVTKPPSHTISKVDTSSLRPNMSTVPVVDVSIVASTMSINASVSAVSGEAKTVSSTPSYFSTNNDSLAVSDVPVIPPKDSTSSLGSTHRPTATTAISNQTFSTPVTVQPSHTISKVDTSSLRPNMSTVPVVDVSIVASSISINASVSTVSGEAKTVSSTPSYFSTNNDSLAVSDVPVIRPKDSTSSLGSTNKPTATTAISNQTFSTPITVPPSYTISKVDTSSLRPNISTVPVVHASTVSINASVSAITGEAQTVPSTPLFTSAYNASFVLTDRPIIPPKDTSSSVASTPMATTTLSNQTLGTSVTKPPSHTMSKVDTSSLRPNMSTVSEVAVSIVASSMSINASVSTVSGEAKTVSSTPSYFSTNNDSLAVSDVPVIPIKDSTSSLASTHTATTPISNQTFSILVTEPPVRRDTLSNVDTASTVANVSARATTSTSIQTSSTLSTAGVARTESVKPSTVVNITLQPTSSFTTNMSTFGLHILSTTAVPPVNATTAEPVEHPTGAKFTSTQAAHVTDSTSTRDFVSFLSTRFQSSTASSTLSKTTVNVTSIESSTSMPVSNFTSATPRRILTPGFRTSPRVTPGPPPPRTSPRLVNVITGAVRVGENGDNRRASSLSMDLNWTDKLLVAATLGVAAVLILLAAFIGLAVYFAGST